MIDFVPARGFEETHEISRDGKKVRSLQSGRMLKVIKGGRVLMHDGDHHRWVKLRDLYYVAENSTTEDEEEEEDKEREVTVDRVERVDDSCERVDDSCERVDDSCENERDLRPRAEVKKSRRRVGMMSVFIVMMTILFRALIISAVIIVATGIAATAMAKKKSPPPPLLSQGHYYMSQALRAVRDLGTDSKPFKDIANMLNVRSIVRAAKDSSSPLARRLLF